MNAEDQPDLPAGPAPSVPEPIGEVVTCWSSDLCHDLPQHPVLELADGTSCSYLAAVAPGGTENAVRTRLEVHLGDRVASPNELRLALMRTMREVDPRPSCIGAAIVRGAELFVAVTHGGSAALVRGGRIVERTVDAARFQVLPGDRLALVSPELDPLVQDADELGRVVSAGDPHGAAMTLVEIGHLRGGKNLAAVVSELLGPADAPADEPVDAGGGVDLGDLLAGLAPALEAHRRTPTPLPRSRRTMVRPAAPTAPRGPRPIVGPAVPEPPKLGIPVPTAAARGPEPLPSTPPAPPVPDAHPKPAPAPLDDRSDDVDTEPGAAPVPSGSLSAPSSLLVAPSPTPPSRPSAATWAVAAGVVLVALAAAAWAFHSFVGGAW